MDWLTLVNWLSLDTKDGLPSPFIGKGMVMLIGCFLAFFCFILANKICGKTHPKRNFIDNLKFAIVLSVLAFVSIYPILISQPQANHF